MQFFPEGTNFNFLRFTKPAMALSGALIVLSIVFFAVRGFSLGIDFTGGTLIEVGYPQSVELNDVRRTLGEAGYGEAVVQHFGTSRDVLIRLAPREGLTAAVLSEQVFQALRGDDSGVEMRRVEFVGPQVGDDLAADGGLAVLFALIGILVYVALRFEYRFALGAVAALVHDVIITLGVFSAFRLEFDLTVLAAVLAVIGYSLNDTIVVFDRIRENFRKMRKGTSEEVVNASLNQTLSRTIVTGLTTLLVLVALFVFGGELIRNFSLALILGILVGTYSSIYIASALALKLGVSKADLMPVKKEGEDLDALP